MQCYVRIVSFLLIQFYDCNFELRYHDEKEDEGKKNEFLYALVRISPRCNPDFLCVVVSAFEKSFATDSFTNKHAYKLPISMVVVF